MLVMLLPVPALPTGMQNLFIVRNPIHKTYPAIAAVRLLLAVLPFFLLFAASRSNLFIDEWAYLSGRWLALL